MKKILCLGLFLLPLLAMFLTLLNQDTGKTVIQKTIVQKNIKTKNIVKTEKTIVKKKAPLKDQWLHSNWVEYKQKNRFQDCKNIDTLIEQWFGEEVFQSHSTVTRIDFLDILLKIHCIDSSNSDTHSIAFSDVKDDDIKTKQIIQKSIEIGIANGYKENGKKVFKPNTEITKIEALAILRKISNFRLKDNTPKNTFTDLDVSWKKKVANFSNILWLLPIDTKNKLFHPNEKLTNKTFSIMIRNILKYYR